MRTAEFNKFLRGVCLSLTAVVLIGVLCLLAYQVGKRKGVRAEQEWMRAKESAAGPVESARTEADRLDRYPGAQAEPTNTPGLGDAAPTDAWCFTPYEAIRMTWPMEIVQDVSRGNEWVFRVREGALILADAGGGVCEFAFRTEARTQVSAFVRCCYSDECGDSIFIAVDGCGRSVAANRSKVFNQWHWDRAERRFALDPGLHRLTLTVREDGLRFDRVVLHAGADNRNTEEVPDRLLPTPTPRFQSLPAVSPTLPAIGALTAQIFTTDSLVIGKGRLNTVSLFLRSQADEARQVQVIIRSPATGYECEDSLQVLPHAPAQLHAWKLPLDVTDEQLVVPVRVDVSEGTSCLASQQLNYINPLTWAFAGPFEDIDHRGLDAVLPPESQLEHLHERPAIKGVAWKTVEDGSCYNDFGSIDLNAVFGLKNEPRLPGAAKPTPMVAYAVTCLYSTHGSPHEFLSCGGDDCVRVWMNGQALLRVDSNMPLTASRQKIGAAFREGNNTFVFKVPQTEYYWQLFFGPDMSLPAEVAGHFSKLRLAVYDIGVYYYRMKDSIEVAQLMPGKPAALDGRLKPGDRIVAIAEGSGEFVPLAGLATAQIERLLTGEDGTRVTLRVQRPSARPGDAPELLELRRAKTFGWE